MEYDIDGDSSPEIIIDRADLNTLVQSINALDEKYKLAIYTSLRHNGVDLDTVNKPYAKGRSESNNITNTQIKQLEFSVLKDALKYPTSSIGEISTNDVLSGKKVWFGNDLQTGTMPNKSSTGYTVTNGDPITIEEGYYNGSGKITLSCSTLKAENIKSGVNILGVTGSYSADLSNAQIQDGHYLLQGWTIPNTTSVCYLDSDNTYKTFNISKPSNFQCPKYTIIVSFRKDNRSPAEFELTADNITAVSAGGVINGTLGKSGNTMRLSIASGGSAARQSGLKQGAYTVRHAIVCIATGSSVSLKYKCSSVGNIETSVTLIDGAYSYAAELSDADSSYYRAVDSNPTAKKDSLYILCGTLDRRRPYIETIDSLYYTRHNTIQYLKQGDYDIAFCSIYSVLPGGRLYFGHDKDSSLVDENVQEEAWQIIRLDP